MNNLSKYRNKSAISQKQLADMSGVSTPYINQIERLKKEPSLRVAQRIVFALNSKGAKCSTDTVFPPNQLKQAV